jgi:hypothetical protein
MARTKQIPRRTGSCPPNVRAEAEVWFSTHPNKAQAEELRTLGGHNHVYMCCSRRLPIHVPANIVHGKDEAGRFNPALHLAASRGQVLVMHALLDSSADVTANWGTTRTPRSSKTYIVLTYCPWPGELTFSASAWTRLCCR